MESICTVLNWRFLNSLTGDLPSLTFIVPPVGIPVLLREEPARHGHQVPRLSVPALNAPTVNFSSYTYMYMVTKYLVRIASGALS